MPVQDSWKITTLDMRTLIDNTPGYRQFTLRNLRREMNRCGWLPGQAAHGDNATHYQAEHLGKFLHTLEVEQAQSYLIPDSMVYDLHMLALNRIDWTELGRQYYGVISEEG